MALMDYIKSPRKFQLLYFMEVVLGFLFVRKFVFGLQDLWTLVLVLISFYPLYFGIHLINDIIDYKTDRLNPKKYNRAVASGRMSRKEALFYSIFLLIFGFLTSTAVNVVLLYFEIFFVSYNLVYSFVLKRIPFVDTLSTGVTHAARFLMGASIAGMFSGYFIAASIFILNVMGFLIKRLCELSNKEQRAALKYYSLAKIRFLWFVLFVILLTFLFFAKSTEVIFVVATAVIYVVILIFYHTKKRARQFINNWANF